MKDLIEVGYIAVGMIIRAGDAIVREVVKIHEPENKEPIVEFDDGQYLYTTIGWDKFPKGVVIVVNSDDYEGNTNFDNVIFVGKQVLN